MNFRVSRRHLPFALFGSAAAALEARADAVSDFYKGKTLSLVVSATADGGYDRLARTVAKHMFAHIPGKPEIVVRNMPGAGGIIAMNYLANTANKDGLVIGCVQANTAFEPLYGTKQAEYDANRINWLGTPSVETGLLVVWQKSAVQTIADATRLPLKAGASGHNSAPSFFARLLNETLGTKIEVVIGFRGQSGAWQAMEKGYIDAYGMTYWSSLTSTRKKWLEDKSIRILVQYGPEKVAELANVPYAPDLIRNPADKAFFEAASAQLSLGRPFAAPPGVPPDRIAALRKALMDTFRDDKFQRDVRRIGLNVNNPRSGEQLQQQVANAYRLPSDTLARIRRLANPPRA